MVAFSKQAPRGCLNTRFGWDNDADGVRPSSGAATREARLAWNIRVQPKYSRCCARGRAHSDAGFFKQALRHFKAIKVPVAR